LWLIVIYFVVVAVPVALGALLSIPTMYVVNFIRQHKWLEYIILVSSVVFIIWGLLKIIDAIPENIDIIGTWGTTFWEIRAFLGKFIENFAVFYLVIQSITGLRNGITTVLFTSTSMMTSFVMLLVVAGVVAITFVIVRPLYFHMASSPFEYKKVKVNHEIKNKFHNPVFSSIKKDMILSYRTQSKFYSLLGIVVGLPIAILLLNKLYAAMDTRLSGTNMTIAFNMLMILLIVLSSNINLAHIYSEEGASTYLLKVNPKPYIQTLFVKLMPNLIGITVSIIGAVSVMCTYLGYGFGKSLLIFGIIESFYVAHLLMSAEMDIMNPQSNQYQTAGTHPNNPNDIKSTIYAFGLSAGIGLLTYFLISESRITIWWKLLGLGLAFLALRIWLYINKIKVYFKEKQG